ncbi:MAG TPA: hypothetical protein VMM60_04930, partial [Ilumatobacter sp.]|nr:hypothetical protein [Ilumatobacter sp.]
MSLHPVRRTARMGLWPLSRPLAAVLLWSHRHTIGLWARSYATELKEQSEGTISLSRLRLLTAALWRVSSDPRFRNDPTVRRLSIDSELTEVDHDARRTSLQDALADLPGVVSVEIDGQVAQVDGLAAEGLGN